MPPYTARRVLSVASTRPGLKTHWCQLLLCAAAALALSCSCSYPDAGLELKTASEETKSVVIRYPSAKMTSHDAAFNQGKWALVFAINDYKQISFPPPGAITDNKWLVHFGLLDGDLKPLGEPRRIDRFDRDQETLGFVFTIHPIEEGFVAVYLEGYTFVYQTFDLDGKRLERRHEFHTVEKKTGLRESVLNVSVHDGKIFLMLRQQPDNMYEGGWTINLVRYGLEDAETKVYKDIFPSEDGWYHARSMKIHFQNDRLHAAWLSGEEHRDKPESNTYRLLPVIHYGACLLEGMQCKLTTINKRTSDMNSTALDFVQPEGKLSILIRNDDKTWLQPISPDAALLGEPECISPTDSDRLLEECSTAPIPPFKITVGAK